MGEGGRQRLRVRGRGSSRGSREIRGRSPMVDMEIRRHPDDVHQIHILNRKRECSRANVPEGGEGTGVGWFVFFFSSFRSPCFLSSLLQPPWVRQTFSVPSHGFDKFSYV